MAIKPETQYPGQSQAADADYPYGTAINVTSPGSGDGTPLEQAWLRDIWGFLQGLLVNGKITASGVVDTAPVSEYLDAVKVLAQGGSRQPVINPNAITPATKITSTAGITWDSTYVYPMKSVATFTKRIDANWLAGDDSGGFPSGLTLTANTWYHYFMIAKTDGTVDYGYDSNIAATNLLADATTYTFFKVIGHIKTSGTSTILKFFKFGNRVVWDVPTTDTTSVPASFADLILAVPPDLNIQARIDVEATAAGGGSADIIVKHKFQTGSFAALFAVTGETVRNVFDIITDTAAKIEHKYQGTAPAAYVVSTIGWTENI